MRKKCKTCGNYKYSKSFYNKKDSKDKLSSNCKKCSDDQTKKIKRTKKGLINVIYATQKYSSKIRGHKPPEYTKKELSEWILSQPNFQELYDNWVLSGYEKDFRPSVDRPDNKKTYSFSNIQLMTWKENTEKHKTDIINGNIQWSCVKVIMHDKENIVFLSAKEAERKTKIPNQNIIAVCKGRRKTAGGYTWSYYNQEQ